MNPPPAFVRSLTRLGRVRDTTLERSSTRPSRRRAAIVFTKQIENESGEPFFVASRQRWSLHPPPTKTPVASAPKVPSLFIVAQVPTPRAAYGVCY